MLKVLISVQPPESRFSNSLCLFQVAIVNKIRVLGFCFFFPVEKANSIVSTFVQEFKSCRINRLVRIPSSADTGLKASFFTMTLFSLQVWSYCNSS